MILEISGKRHASELVIVCYPGIFSPAADKTGSVFIYGGDGRAALGLVEQARMLYREYPEECLTLAPGAVALERERRREVLADPVLVLARGRGFSLLGTGVDPGDTREALRRLQRYVTRLVRMDVP